MKKIAKWLLVWFFFLLLVATLAFFEHAKPNMVALAQPQDEYSCPEPTEEVTTEEPTEVPVVPTDEPTEAPTIEPTDIPTESPTLPVDPTLTPHIFPSPTFPPPIEPEDEDNDRVVIYNPPVSPKPTVEVCNLCLQEKRQADALEKIALFFEKLLGKMK